MDSLGVTGLFTNSTTADGSGFLSGHALGTTMVWGGLALVLDRGTYRLRAGAAGIVVGLVSLSRLVLGVHYFIDVLVGVVLGVMVLGVLYWLADYGTDPGQVLVLTGGDSESIVMFLDGRDCYSLVQIYTVVFRRLFTSVLHKHVTVDALNAEVVEQVGLVHLRPVGAASLRPGSSGRAEEGNVALPNVRETMHAYEVRETDPDYEGIVRVERERPRPDADEAVLRVRACSLNYRDLAIANADLSYPGTNFPVIPLSDGAGDIVAVGDDVERLSEGDRVATPFAPNWIDGPGTPEKLTRTTGGTVDGALAEYAAFPAESITVLPDHLSYEEGATLSCAGLTAWRALVEDGNLAAGETILALGTGGVSTFALQFATMHGASTVITSSSDEKLERARELGADETINYESTPDWGDMVQQRIGGVDHVVEVGGPGTLERSLRAAGVGGHVHLIGVLTGHEGQVDPSPILQKSLDIEGVMGVGSCAMFNRMTDAMAVTGMEPVIDQVFSFDEVRDAYRYVESGEHQGKVVVSVE